LIQPQVFPYRPFAASCFDRDLPQGSQFVLPQGSVSTAASLLQIAAASYHEVRAASVIEVQPQALHGPYRKVIPPLTASPDECLDRKVRMIC
jgi:hypothetical protein